MKQERGQHGSLSRWTGGGDSCRGSEDPCSVPSFTWGGLYLLCNGASLQTHTPSLVVWADHSGMSPVLLLMLVPTAGKPAGFLQWEEAIVIPHLSSGGCFGSRCSEYFSKINWHVFNAKMRLHSRALCGCLWVKREFKLALLCPSWVYVPGCSWRLTQHNIYPATNYLLTLSAKWFDYFLCASKFLSSSIFHCQASRILI